MGEFTATYQVADLVADLTEATHQQRPELLQWTITHLTPLWRSICARELSWADDPQELDARFAAVFLDLLFTQLDAERFDEPTSALCHRLTRDKYGNVSARQAGQETLTGVASDLITAAWFTVVDVYYSATTFAFYRYETNRCLRLATDGGPSGRDCVLDTTRIAAHSAWAYTIETGSRNPQRPSGGAA